MSSSQKALNMSTNIAYLALTVLFLLILVYFGGRNSKKSRGQYVNGVRFQKKFWIFHFFDQRQKSNTQVS